MERVYKITKEVVTICFENSKGKTDFVRIEISYGNPGVVSYASAYIGDRRFLGVVDELYKNDVIKKVMDFVFVYEKF